jgi:hypothetical protein
MISIDVLYLFIVLPFLKFVFDPQPEKCSIDLEICPIAHTHVGKYQ